MPPEAMLGFDTADDAAVWRIAPNIAGILTIDFLTPIVDEPYDFGRIAAANALSPDLLLSIHGNSAPEGSTASGFECYPTVPGRTWHRESYYFAKQLASAMRSAGASLRGRGGIRYIYYIGETKQLVESSHTEVREERSFTILEDVNCPAVLAEQCFVTSEEDVAQFGSEDGCRRTARAYYEAICAYFETTPLPE